MVLASALPRNRPSIWSDCARECIEELFGELDAVFHELFPLIPHVDVYRFPPSGDRDFYSYVTGGMSDEPDVVARGGGADARRVELVFYASEDNQEYSDLLRTLAHFPHDNRTWLHWGHTMPNGTPPRPILGAEALDSFFFMPHDRETGLRVGGTLELERRSNQSRVVRANQHGGMQAQAGARYERSLRPIRREGPSVRLAGTAEQLRLKRPSPC